LQRDIKGYECPQISEFGQAQGRPISKYLLALYWCYYGGPYNGNALEGAEVGVDVVNSSRRVAQVDSVGGRGIDIPLRSVNIERLKSDSC
jgi:hypothetical protein